MIHLPESVVQKIRDSCPVGPYWRTPVETYLARFTVCHGFLLHGSPHDVEVLEPRSESGGPPAVYATHIPYIALFFAIAKNPNVNVRYQLETSKEPGSPPAFKSNYKGERGFVYLVESAGFSPISPVELACHSDSVIPAAKIPVKVTDFGYALYPFSFSDISATALQ